MSLILFQGYKLQFEQLSHARYNIIFLMNLDKLHYTIKQCSVELSVYGMLEGFFKLRLRGMLEEC